MKKGWITVCVLIGLVSVFLAWQTGQRQSPSTSSHNPRPTASPLASTKTAASREWDRFAIEVLPITDDFVARIQSAAAVHFPFRLPILADNLTAVRFSGGQSNTVCSFVVNGQSAFGYHFVHRDGKQVRGIHSFNRTGKDENGLPLNLDQLKASPAANELHFRALTDRERYPLLSMSDVAPIAEKVLASLVPDAAEKYKMAESWQEQIGTNALPFYAFVFPRKAAPSTEPSNLMRDEITLIFKSTSSGLVLDYFSDTSIAFAFSKSKSR